VWRPSPQTGKLAAGAAAGYGPEVASAGAAMVDLVARAGVRRIYTVPGESFLEVLDAASEHPSLQLVSTRHESGAAFMADAEAKLTGKPALAMASRAPGACNLAIGVHTARQDSSPLVAVLGQVRTSVLGREALQEADLAALYRPLAKWVSSPSSSARLAPEVAEALRVAASGRPGPAVVVVPTDMFAGEAGPEVLEPRPPADAGGLSEESCARVAAELGGAVRPVIVAGGGCRHATAELVRVAERYGAGVFAAWRRQDVFPNEHPHHLGHLGIDAPASILAALEQADLVLVVGCRLSEVTTQGYRYPRAGSRVVHIDAESASIGASGPVALGVVAEARTALAQLAEAGGAGLPAETGRARWSAAHAAYLAYSRPAGETAPAGMVHPEAAVAALASALPEDAIVASDAGNFAAFLHRFFRYRAPRTQLAPTSGAMGYGVPAAVAARLVAPERAVVAVVGDGGALMTGQELETAVRYGAPVVVVVFRNGLYGTIAMHQARSFGRLAGVGIGGPSLDLSSWARGLGARGILVHGAGELADAVSEAISSGAPTLVDVPTDPEAISPAARLSALFEGSARGGEHADEDPDVQPAR
jgi:acetolactate synthase-1/2/3 large subunit